MNLYSQLFHQLDKDPQDFGAMEAYFGNEDPADASWAAWLLSGKRMKLAINWEELKAIISGATGLPMWLVEDSHAKVGNWAETTALLV